VNTADCELHQKADRDRVKVKLRGEHISVSQICDFCWLRFML